MTDHAATRVDLAETVTCPQCHASKDTRCVTRAGNPARAPHGRRIDALEQAAGITQHRKELAQSRGPMLSIDHAAEDVLLATYAAKHCPTAPVQDAQGFQRATPAEDAPTSTDTPARHPQPVPDLINTLYTAALRMESAANNARAITEQLATGAAEARRTYEMALRTADIHRQNVARRAQ